MQYGGRVSLKHLVKNLETGSYVIQSLMILINKMAVSMESMLTEQRKQGGRLEVLERVPIETNKQVKVVIITALVGGIVGTVLIAIITSL